ncbi:MAG: DUF3320 domain-containing protein [Microbacterium sp.]
MNDFDAINHVEDALSTTAQGLGPFITARFRQLLPELSNWPDILAQKDRQAGRNVDRYNPRDLSLMLRALTEHLGALGYPFSDLLTRQASNCASELRGVRNKWAHSEEFSVAETFRALDSAEILLRSIHADAEADHVAAQKTTVLRFMTQPTITATVPAELSDDSAPDPADETLPSAAKSEVENAAELTRISITTLPVLSYAHAHNSIPVVTSITIDHEGGELRGASLEVEVLCQLGPLGDPRIVIVDLYGNAPTVLRNTELLLDPARMFAVESPMPGTVAVTLRNSDNEILTREEATVQILAANQWQAVPQQLSLELLATFVQPNSPTIPALLLEASDLLGQSTASSALDGYQQQSRERVDSIVEAIYDAMRARDIRYAEPPASWGIGGQKVRTPTEVLEGRLGTCLDTTLTLAAVLEEAGINSTLWLLDGHIFLGYWRDEASLDAPAQLDASEVVNYVGLGQIGLVETTMLTGGASSRPFAEAARDPHHAGYISSPEKIVGVTDIRQARNARVFPLPSRSISADGEVTVHEYQVGAAPQALSYSPSAEDLAGAPARNLPHRVQVWKNALLDLSLRNRLINYTDASGVSLAIPQPSLAHFEDMINEGTAVTLIPSDRIPNIEVNRGIRYGRDLPETARAELLNERKSAFVDITEGAYIARLRSLAYKARTITEETGSNNLYIAFGMLRWKFNDRELSSPLVLVPVTLEASGRGNVYRLKVDDAGESTPNYCLLEKLRVSFGVEIPGLANPAKDDAGINLSAAFAATRQALTEARLPFTVDDTADLSILQFGKFRLWKDLDENWETFTSNPLVSHLINTPTETFEDPSPAPTSVDLDALGNSVPVPADSSQLEAVADAVADRTFVLEGPPGTGKSQTITNLLAHALVSGKRVLFVAEKRAALDVVKDRLETVGLGPYSLDLHDKGARPNAVRAQIREALDAMARPDAAALKAQYENAASSRGSLRRYAERLHESNTAGMSLYSARETLLAFPESMPMLDVPASIVAGLSEDRLEAVRTALRGLPETADLAHPSPLNAWGFVRVAGEHPSNLNGLHDAAREFDRALTEAATNGADMATLLLARSADFIERWSQLSGAPRYSLDALDQFRPRYLSGEVPNLQKHLSAMTTTPPSWFATVSPECLDTDVVAVHTAAQAADASGFFGRRKRQRAALQLFGAALRVTPKVVPAKTVSALTGEIASTALAVTNVRDALATLPVLVAASDWNPYLREDAQSTTTTIDWARWLSEALTPRTDSDEETRALRDHYRNSSASGALASALASLARAWRTLEAATSGSESSGSVLSDWAASRSVIDAWGMTRTARALDTEQPTTLNRWVDFVRALEPLRAHGMDTARQSLLIGAIPADIAVMAFDKGAAAASISERAASQALESFDAKAHGRAIDRFTDSTSAIRAELPRWIPAEILAKRRIDADYSGGQLGELKRQLSRQRGGMSVRALFTSYGDLITQIAPCVLMSPESVSRFFPAAAAMFDIVVFDEASQIRVADAVGAMGRARSVVVVGDSKQMPPSTFAEVTADADLESGANQDAIQDEESILTECVQAQVPRRWLSWHYRSQDESLISFSNHKYYESRLASFPAPWPGTTPTIDADHGVSLVRVNGHFNRSGRGRDLRTNPIEAHAIVDEVARRFASSGGDLPSLGIITFNAPQRTLIESLLREAPDERIAAALDQRDGLFVKNLENVQGDERDVILFSVAFSANERGVIPLNFGPLSRAGGERRLNVAITRARRQVILFASFDPAELRAEQTTSVGIKHLRAYLELAANGVESISDDLPRERVIDRHRDEIANELRMRGYAVQTDIGLSDFRVDISIGSAADPTQPVLAILLDGESWRSRRTVADRDGLPVEVLSKIMRWPGVQRVWLPEWLQDRDATLERIESAADDAETVLEARVVELARAREDEAETIVTRPAFLPKELSTEAPPVSALDAPISTMLRGGPSSTETSAPILHHDRLRTFVEWPARQVGTTETLDQLPSPAAAQQVRRLVQEIITSEGPIHKMRLVKLVAAAYGLNKVHASRAEAILRCVDVGHSRLSDPATLWSAGEEPSRWREARQSQPGSGRNIDHVSLAEIANAMAIVAELGGGMSRDELKREALRIFGGKRMTEGIGARFESGLGYGIESGRLELRPTGRYVAIV